ncbi:MAG TPA: F0F1 ATP synthase subunit B [Clostridiaceae bacterium]|jgi:F-type H+-transporting ATPase subunit b|nr:F0F1 ATP synthase subunit B [Clostridiaceae bacterium]
MFISSIIQPVLLDMSQRVMPLILSAEAAVEEPGLIAPEQMAGYTVTVLFTVINIIAAYLILKRFVFKPIMLLLATRRQCIEDEINQAEEAKKQAQALFADSKRASEQTRSEATDILSEARIQSEKQALIIIEKAKEDAEQIRLRAKEDSDRLHAAMLEQMKDEVADLAVKIASKVVGNVIDESQQKALSERILMESLNTEVKDID